MLPFLGALSAWQAILNELPFPVFSFIIVVFAFLVVLGVIKTLLSR